MVPYYMIIFLTLSALLWVFIPTNNINVLRTCGLACFSILLIMSFYLIGICQFNDQLAVFHFWLLIDFNYIISVDPLSAWMIWLTQLILWLCILSSWSNIKEDYDEFIFFMLVLDLCLVNLFVVVDIFFFYIFFEALLIPMVVLIGNWGTRQRRVHAALQFFFLTLAGSFCMLIGIALIYSNYGTTNLLVLNYMEPLREDLQILVWLCFFIAFAIKVPMFPFHIWLPEAHVEAPTVGSAILAGILLKIGPYGFLRFMIPLLPYANAYFLPFVLVLCGLGALFTAITALRQVDLKKAIAYASVSHMSIVMMGIFSNSAEGTMGSVVLMLTHGVVASGLFFAVGMLYERYHVRLIKSYGGLIYTMPLFGILTFLLLLGNFSFPGTGNFIGELLILIGLSSENLFATMTVLLSIIPTTIYSIWIFNRIFFGKPNEDLKKTSDVTAREFFILAVCVIVNLYFGLCPSYMLQTIEPMATILSWIKS